MTARGTALRLIAKYGADEAQSLAETYSFASRFAYTLGGTRPASYYLVRWTFWDAVARRAGSAR